MMLADRRTKIVATIGPATASRENLKKLIISGMNVARLNFSHGNHEDHLKVLLHLRSLSEELKAPVTVLQDLQGPKIRVGRFKNGDTAVVAALKPAAPERSWGSTPPPPPHPLHLRSIGPPDWSTSLTQ